MEPQSRNQTVCAEIGLRRARKILDCHTGTLNTFARDIICTPRSTLHRPYFQTILESKQKWCLTFPHPEIHEWLRDTLKIKNMCLYCNNNPNEHGHGRTQCTRAISPLPIVTNSNKYEIMDSQPQMGKCRKQ